MTVQLNRYFIAQTLAAMTANKWPPYETSVSAFLWNQPFLDGPRSVFWMIILFEDPWHVDETELPDTWWFASLEVPLLLLRRHCAQKWFKTQPDVAKETPNLSELPPCLTVGFRVFFESLVALSLKCGGHVICQKAPVSVQFSQTFCGLSTFSWFYFHRGVWFCCLFAFYPVH